MSKKGDLIEEKGLFAVIIDKNEREATRHYIARGSVIETANDEVVTPNTILARPQSDDVVVIAQWDPFSDLIIAEEEGVISYRHIYAGLTVSEIEDVNTGESYKVINDYISNEYSPALILKTKDTKGKTVEIEYLLEAGTSVLVQEKRQSNQSTNYC